MKATVGWSHLRPGAIQAPGRLAAAGVCCGFPDIPASRDCPREDGSPTFEIGGFLA